MPSKYRIILEMASQTARDIASNADRYTDFLITAANNYKYSFTRYGRTSCWHWRNTTYPISIARRS